MGPAGVEYDVDMGFSWVQFIWNPPSKFDNLTGNGSSDKVSAKSNIWRVSETGRGGRHGVDWVGGGKSTKVVEPVEKIVYNTTNHDLFKMLQRIM